MTRFQSFIILLIALFLTTSCEKDNISVKTGNLEFSFSEENALSGGRIKGNISSILISLEDVDGNPVHERKNITLYKFGEDFLSEPIALTTGSYKLTEFIVLDENQAAIYATPLEGSPLAYLVESPLPLDFTITKDNTTKVSPEIIKIEGSSSADFGYVAFGFDIVNTFTFSAGVLAYNSTSENFELTNAHMEISASGEILYDMDLPAMTNGIRVKDGFDNYHLIVIKEGYINYEKTFTADQLKQYVSGTPLVVTLLVQSLSERLIAHYPFNGNANDQTVNHFDGTIHEAVLTTDRKGTPDAAYSFDGVNDYISVPHNNVLNLSGDFTISLWTNVSSAQEPHEGINDILRKWNGDAAGYPFSISYLNPLADDSHEDKIIYARYGGQTCNQTATTYSPVITNDTFIHIVLIKDGNKIRTYLNNVLMEEITDPTTCSVANTADMTIGCRGNLVRFFKGKIDDIRIYDRALTEVEVGNLNGE